MKKILTGLIALLFIGIASIKAQSEKEIKPPPPPLPKRIDVVEKVLSPAPPKPPTITVTGKKADEFYTRNPSVAGISRQGNIIKLKLKDGTEEKYDMNKKEEHESLIDKYGVSPIPPPPPPPKIIDEKIKVSAPPPPKKTT